MKAEDNTRQAENPYTMDADTEDGHRTSNKPTRTNERPDGGFAFWDHPRRQETQGKGLADRGTRANACSPKGQSLRLSCARSWAPCPALRHQNRPPPVERADISADSPKEFARAAGWLKSLGRPKAAMSQNGNARGGEPKGPARFIAGISGDGDAPRRYSRRARTTPTCRAVATAARDVVSIETYPKPRPLALASGANEKTKSMRRYSALALDALGEGARHSRSSSKKSFG